MHAHSSLVNHAIQTAINLAIILATIYFLTKIHSHTEACAAGNNMGKHNGIGRNLSLNILGLKPELVLAPLLYIRKENWPILVTDNKSRICPMKSKK